MFVSSDQRERGSSRHAPLRAPQRHEGWNHPHLQPHPLLSRGAAAAERAADGHAGGCLLLPVTRPGTKGRKRDGERVVSGGRGLSQALPWGRGGGTARGQNMAAAWGPEGWDLEGRESSRRAGLAHRTGLERHAGTRGLSSGHWGAMVVRELRRCAPGPGAGL